VVVVVVVVGTSIGSGATTAVVIAGRASAGVTTTDLINGRGADADKGEAALEGVNNELVVVDVVVDADKDSEVVVVVDVVEGDEKGNSFD